MLEHHRAIPEAPTLHAGNYRITGEIPVGSVHRFQQQLPETTNGEGVFESTFSRYLPVRGTPPVRPRTDNNPLNKDDYLARVARR